MMNLSKRYKWAIIGLIVFIFLLHPIAYLTLLKNYGPWGYLLFIIPIILAGSFFGPLWGSLVSMWSILQMILTTILLKLNYSNATGFLLLLSIVFLGFGYISSNIRHRLSLRSSFTGSEHLLALALKTLTLSKDLQELAENTVEVLRKFWKYNFPAIIYYDEDRDKLVISAFHGYPVPKNSSFNIGQGISGLAAKEKRPVIVNDLRGNPLYLPGVPGALSEIAYPILKDGKLLGVINIESKKLNAFGPEDLQTLSVISDFLAVLISRNQTLMALDQMNSDLSSFYNSLISLMEVLEKPGFFDVTLKNLLTFPDVLLSALWIREGKYLRFEGSQIKKDIKRPDSIGIFTLSKDSPIYMDEPILQRLIRKSSPVVISHGDKSLDLDELLMLRNLQKDLGNLVRSVILLPVVGEHGIIGLLAVVSTHKELSQERIQILEAYSKALTIAYSTRKSSEILRFLNNLSRMAFEFPREADLVYEILNNLKRIVPNDWSCIMKKTSKEPDSVEVCFLNTSKTSKAVIQIKNSILKEAIDEDRTVVVQNLSDDHPDVPLLIGQLKDIKSLVLVPIDYKDGVLGLLVVGKRLFDSFSEEDITLLEEVSDMLSVVLHNIWLQERLQQESIADPLTGLKNRRYLIDRALEEIARANRKRSVLSLMLIDLVDFKRVNDTYGHLFGDEVLTELAKRISMVIRTADIPARYGGDEFVILMPDTSYRAAETAARRVIRAIQKPINIKDKSVLIRANIGIASFPSDGTDIETLLDMADRRMYQAKQKGVPIITL